MFRGAPARLLVLAALSLGQLPITRCPGVMYRRAPTSQLLKLKPGATSNIPATTSLLLELKPRPRPLISALTSLNLIGGLSGRCGRLRRRRNLD
jgi:hypothetical protein